MNLGGQHLERPDDLSSPNANYPRGYHRHHHRWRQTLLTPDALGESSFRFRGFLSHSLVPTPSADRLKNAQSTYIAFAKLNKHSCIYIYPPGIFPCYGLRAKDGLFTHSHSFANSFFFLFGFNIVVVGCHGPFLFFSLAFISNFLTLFVARFGFASLFLVSFLS